MIPTPARVSGGLCCWYVWFIIPAGNSREWKLVMVPR